VTVFAVKGEILRRLRADPEWLQKALQCNNLVELQQVFVEFSQVQGFKIVEVPIK
jgi:hypothetical protein